MKTDDIFGRIYIQLLEVTPLSLQVACELYPSRVVALCLDPYCGLGLALWVLSSIYSGHQSILIPPGEVSQFRIDIHLKSV